MASKTSCDVVIIGGGFAGVTAARDLQKRGLSTIAREARDRLGGAPFMKSTMAFMLNLVALGFTGLSRLYGLRTNAAGLRFKKHQDVSLSTSNKIDGTVQELQEAQLGEFVEGFERFFAESKGVWDRPYDTHHCWEAVCELDALTVADRFNALEPTPLQHTSLGGFLEILSMNQPQNASYVEMMRTWSLTGGNYEFFNDTAARYKFTKGTSALVEEITLDGGFEVALNTVVRSVQYTGEGVSVTMQAGERLKAQRAVVTVPLTVLHNVQFEPPPSDVKLEVSRLKHVGGGCKMFLK